MDSVSHVDDVDEQTIAIGDASAPAAEYTDAGGRLGRYIVIEELGRGGMGRVLRGYDPRLQREVALKVLPTRSMSEEGRARMVSEARAMARVSHPNVVAVYDVEDHGDHGLVLAMEYVAGQTLREWLRAETRPWTQIIERFCLAGQALVAAHAEGLLHRDFKPANVLVSSSGEVKVTDFGLAKSLDAPGGLTRTHGSDDDAEDDELTTEGLTRAGTVMGTPRYMSPEQHEGSKLTPSADQYAFCIALWEALAGEPPFSGKDMAAAKTAGAPVWSSSNSVPSRVVNAIRRGLEPRSLERWPSMAELIDALSQELTGGRPRRWGALAGLAILATAAGGAAAVYGTHEGPCQGAEAQLEGVWDDTTRAAVQSAIANTGASFSSGVWEYIEPRLDDYGSRWVQMHTEACEATNVRRSQSADIMDRRMVCLQRARTQLQATTSLLGRADEETLVKAHELVEQLLPLHPCADVEALLEGTAPPSATEAGAVASASEQLARARVAYDAGLVDESEQAIAEAERLLNGVTYGPVRTELLQVRGSTLSSRGKFTEAEAVYREALPNAVRFKQWREVLHLSDSLLYLVSTKLGKPAEAMRYAEYGDGLIDVIGDPLLEAAHRKMLGAALHYAGDFAASEAEDRKALEILEARLPPDDLAIARARINLGIVLDESGHPQEAEKQHRAALRVTLDALGPGHPDVAMLRTNLGNALSAQLKLEESLDEHRASLEIYEKAFGPDHPGVAFSHNNIGGSLYKAKRYADAEAEFRLALDLWKKALGPDHPDLALAYNNIAECLLQQDQLAEAEAPFRRSLELIENNLGADHPDAATIRGNLANLLSELDRGAEALPLAEQSWKAVQRDDIPAEQKSTVAYRYGTALWAEGSDRAKARKMVEEALRMSEDVDPGVKDQFQKTFQDWLDAHPL